MPISPRAKSRQQNKKNFSFSYAGYNSDNDVIRYDDNEELKGYVSYGNPRSSKGKSLKPPLSCRHTKYTVEQGWETVFNGGGFFSPTVFPSNSMYGPISIVEGYALDLIDPLVYTLVNEIEKKFRPLDNGFNLFNFLYEMREVASLLDPAKAVLKRLIPPSKRKSKRAKKAIRDGADDIASTYVNAQFGYVPTISDGFEIFRRLGSLEDSFKNLKEALKPRRSRKSRTIPITFTTPLLWGENSAARVRYKLTFRGTAKVSVSARCKFKMDMLESLGPLLASVQQGGLAQLNLATIWNAVPFSWAVDWLLPIGDALDSLSGDPLGIQRDVSGTYSYLIKGSWFVRKEDIIIDHPTAVNPWDGHPIDDSFGKISVYNRNPLPIDLEAYRHPPVKLPKLDLRKLLISVSIAKPW